MKDYKFVERKHGNVSGFWFAEQQDAENKEVVTALTIKHGFPHEISANALLGAYEIWRNTFDSRGGYFALFSHEDIPTLSVAEDKTETKSLGLVRCRCGSLYKGCFNGQTSLLCGCGQIIEVSTQV